MNLHQTQRLIYSYILGLCHGKNAKRIEVNSQLGACLQDCAEFIPDVAKETGKPEDAFKIGKFNSIEVFVDPLCKFSDIRICFLEEDGSKHCFRPMHELHLEQGLII